MFPLSYFFSFTLFLSRGHRNAARVLNDLLVMLNKIVAGVCACGGVFAP